MTMVTINPYGMLLITVACMLIQNALATFGRTICVQVFAQGTY